MSGPNPGQPRGEVQEENRAGKPGLSYRMQQEMEGSGQKKTVENYDLLFQRENENVRENY